MPGLTVADAFLRLHVDGAELRRAVATDVEGAGAPAGAAFGKAFRAASIAALAGIGVAIGIGAIATKQATEFQAAMTRIRTQAGGTAKDVQVLTGAVLNLASTRAQQGPQQLAAALYHLKSVGLDDAKAMEALRTASDLAAVGGADLESTTNALAGAWRTGIRGATSFGKAAATVNAIIGAGNMTLSDFVSAIGTGILPAAKTWGLSLGQVGSALALMTDEGQNAAEAATRLRMTFALLGAPSAVAAKQLAQIGITGLQLGEAMRSPGGLIAAITLLKTHLDASGLSATQSAALLARAFGGGRSSATILGLINNLDVLRKKQDQINTSTGKYGAAVAAQRQTAEAQLHRLGAIFDTLGIKIGLALLPPVTAFVSFLVNKAGPEVASFATSAISHLSNLVPVDAIKRDWNALLVWLGARQAPAPKLFTGDLLHLPKPAPLTTADLIHAPRRVTLPMSVDLLHRPAGGSQQQAGSLTNTLASTIQGINWGRIIGLLRPPLGIAMGKAFGWITQHAATITSQLVQALAGLDWVSIGKAVGGHTLGFAIGLVTSFGSELFSPSFWEHHWLDVVIAALSIGGIGKIAGKLLPVISRIPVLRIFAPLFSALDKIGAPIFDTAVKVVRTLIRAFLEGFDRGFPEVTGRLLHWLDLMRVRVVIWGQDILTAGLRAAQGLLAGIVRGVAGLGEIIGRVIRAITLPFRGAGGWLINAGRDVVSGLLHGIRAFMAGIGSWVKGNIVDPLINAVKHFFGIHSPSTVMAGIGGHLMAGLLKGMVAGSAGLVHAVFGSFPSALGHLVSKGLVSITSLPGKALRALGGLGGKIAGLLGFGGGGGGGAASWAGTISAVLRMLSLPASYLGPWLSQVATESGGNARAVNLSDINARLGHPSVGGLQVIGPTFAAYAGPFRNTGPFMYGVSVNKLANAYAAINYAMHRYGRVGMLGVIGHGHGYWRGGTITEPILGLGRSGRWYSFGERGEETVIPGRQRHGGGPLVVFGDTYVHEAADIALIEQKLAHGIMTAGLGGNG